MSFSIIFQVSDDLEDIIEDKDNNYISKYEKKKCIEIYKLEMEKFLKNLKKLQLESALFKEIINYLNNKVYNGF